MRKLYKKFKKKQQLKKEMKKWIKLCKRTPEIKPIGVGIIKVGELTHKININGVGKISTRDPIIIYK